VVVDWTGEGQRVDGEGRRGTLTTKGGERMERLTYRVFDVVQCADEHSDDAVDDFGVGQCGLDDGGAEAARKITLGLR
jgi:hypothetical protein